MAINQDKLHEFLGKAIVDFGATFNAALIRIGDKLGLYKALAAGGAQTPAELAKRTGTAERPATNNHWTGALTPVDEQDTPASHRCAEEGAIVSAGKRQDAGALLAQDAACDAAEGAGESGGSIVPARAQRAIAEGDVGPARTSE